ncbi:MAG: ArgE/DapE family deacylase [Acidimicrobiia bacterium]|nr:ArgE/DapE family deacylase [Acidimicrobiia bacterium]
MNRIESDLRQLVSIPSVTGDEAACQDTVAGLLREAGLRVERIEADPESLRRDPAFPGCEVARDRLPIVAGHLDTGVGGPRTMLVGHVDVVPPGDQASWSRPAFEPWVEEGRLYGRGACDMKGGLVAAIEALRRIREHGSELTGEIIVLAVPSEEDGGAGSLAAIRAGYTGDACVITEPTGLEIVVAHAGAITFTLDVPGKAAHASIRREGVSALEHLTYLGTALAQDEKRRNESEEHPLMRAIGLPYATIIGQVEGGSWASTVMDRVVAHGRYGVRLGQDCDGAAEELTAAVTTAWMAHPFLADHPVRLNVWGARFDSAAIESDHELPVGLGRAFQEVTGRKAPGVGVPYGADMRLFINEGDTPTVMFGPGDVKVAHAADEYVRLDEVETCAATLTRWLLNLHGNPSGSLGAAS